MNVIEIRVTQRDRDALVGLKPAVVSDDEAGQAGHVKKPWGMEYRASASENEDVWKLHLDGGAETSMHCHPNKDTVLIVADGTVMFETLDQRYCLTVGAIVSIERGAFHRTTAHYEGATVIEIESPPNKRDLVRLSDKYGR